MFTCPRAGVLNVRSLLPFTVTMYETVSRIGADHGAVLVWRTQSLESKTVESEFISVFQSCSNSDGYCKRLRHIDHFLVSTWDVNAGLPPSIPQTRCVRHHCSNLFLSVWRDDAFCHCVVKCLYYSYSYDGGTLILPKGPFKSDWQDFPPPKRKKKKKKRRRLSPSRLVGFQSHCQIVHFVLKIQWYQQWQDTSLIDWLMLSRFMQKCITTIMAISVCLYQQIK